MGDFTRSYQHTLSLVSDNDVQLRHNCIESARKSANRLLETKCGKNYTFKIRLYPHHVLRENPLASGAGADRMSTGMTMSFGKPIGIAAQVKKGKTLMDVQVDEKDLDTAKTALKRAQYKLPIHCIIKVKKNVVKKEAVAKAVVKAAK